MIYDNKMIVRLVTGETYLRWSSRVRDETYAGISERESSFFNRINCCRFLSGEKLVREWSFPTGNVSRGAINMSFHKVSATMFSRRVIAPSAVCMRANDTVSMIAINNCNVIITKSKPYGYEWGVGIYPLSVIQTFAIFTLRCACRSSWNNLRFCTVSNTSKNVVWHSWVLIYGWVFHVMSNSAISQCEME